MNKNKIGLMSLAAIGFSTIIGSGWLFTAYYAAKIAGLGAFSSWLITGIIILVLGLALAEIATIHPKMGLMARLLSLSHNNEFAFISTIATWLGLTAVLATEAVSTLQYLANISTIGPIIFSAASHQLTGVGMVIGVGILSIFCLFNYWGVVFLARSNALLTLLKIIVPIVTAVTIIIATFHPGNFAIHAYSFSSHSVTSVFVAIINAGLLYSFNGFQNMASFSAEVEHPERNIPMAMLIAIGSAFLLYVLLEVAFIGAMRPVDVAQGWEHLNFTSPFVQITALLGFHALTMILYADSIISPSATGLVTTGGATRLLTGMSQEKQIPGYFGKLSVYHFSRQSLIFTILLAISFLLIFRSWAILVPLLSLFYLISYMAIPLCLGRLRQQHIKGSFRVPLAQIVLPTIFIILGLLYTHSKFQNILYVTLLLGIFYFINLIVKWRLQKTPLWQLIGKSIAFLGYLLMLMFISILGPSAYGGNNSFSEVTLDILVTVTTLMFYWLSTYTTLCGKWEGSCDVIGTNSRNAFPMT